MTPTHPAEPPDHRLGKSRLEGPHLITFSPDFAPMPDLLLQENEENRHKHKHNHKHSAASGKARSASAGSEEKGGQRVSESPKKTVAEPE